MQFTGVEKKIEAEPNYVEALTNIEAQTHLQEFNQTKQF